MSEELKMKSPGIDKEAGRIRFDYIKSNYFRVIHVDGVFGGPAPGADQIQMDVWNERWPIPKQTAHEISAGGELGEEILDERITRDAIVREVEAQLIMSIATAKKIREWLDKKIEKAEEKTGEGEKE